MQIVHEQVGGRIWVTFGKNGKKLINHLEKQRLEIEMFWICKNCILSIP